MKSIVLAVIAVLAVGYANSSVLYGAPLRYNLSVGGVYVGDKLLLRRSVYRPPIANSVQSEDLVYTGNRTTRITGVFATEQGYTQYANAYIVRGGLNANNVTVRFQSSRGYGYNYVVDIYGR